LNFPQNASGRGELLFEIRRKDDTLLRMHSRANVFKRVYAYVPNMVKGKPKPEGTETVRLNLTISKDLNDRFRKVVFERLGLRKGDIQRAVEEAIKLWIAKEGV